MFFGLGVVNMDLGGLVAIIVAIIGVIVWFVRLEGSTKNNKKDIHEMRCELKEFKNLTIEMALIKQDVGFIKKSMKESKDQNKKIIELLTDKTNPSS
jgi:hypothetical protein